MPTAVALPLGVTQSGGYMAGAKTKENLDFPDADTRADATFGCFFRSTHILELLSTSTGPIKSGMIGWSDVWSDPYRSSSVSLCLTLKISSPTVLVVVCPW